MWLFVDLMSIGLQHQLCINGWWIHLTWIKNCEIIFTQKVFYCSLLWSSWLTKNFEEGIYFWGSARIFITAWFLDFFIPTLSITRITIWVCLPNSSFHLWYFLVFNNIGNTLDTYIKLDLDKVIERLCTYAIIHVEIDFSKGLLDKPILE